MVGRTVCYGRSLTDDTADTEFLHLTGGAAEEELDGTFIDAVFHDGLAGHVGMADAGGNTSDGAATCRTGCQFYIHRTGELATLDITRSGITYHTGAEDTLGIIGFHLDGTGDFAVEDLSAGLGGDERDTRLVRNGVGPVDGASVGNLEVLHHGRLGQVGEEGVRQHGVLDGLAGTVKLTGEGRSRFNGQVFQVKVGRQGYLVGSLAEVGHAEPAHEVGGIAQFEWIGKGDGFRGHRCGIGVLFTFVATLTEGLDADLVSLLRFQTGNGAGSRLDGFEGNGPGLLIGEEDLDAVSRRILNRCPGYVNCLGSRGSGSDGRFAQDDFRQGFAAGFIGITGTGGGERLHAEVIGHAMLQAGNLVLGIGGGRARRPGLFVGLLVFNHVPFGAFYGIPGDDGRVVEDLNGHIGRSVELGAAFVAAVAAVVIRRGVEFGEDFVDAGRIGRTFEQAAHVGSRQFGTVEDTVHFHRVAFRTDADGSGSTVVVTDEHTVVLVVGVSVGNGRTDGAAAGVAAGVGGVAEVAHQAAHVHAAGGSGQFTLEGAAGDLQTVRGEAGQAAHAAVGTVADGDVALALAAAHGTGASVDTTDTDLSGTGLGDVAGVDAILGAVLTATFLARPSDDTADGGVGGRGGDVQVDLTGVGTLDVAGQVLAGTGKEIAAADTTGADNVTLGRVFFSGRGSDVDGDASVVRAVADVSVGVGNDTANLRTLVSGRRILVDRGQHVGNGTVVDHIVDAEVLGVTIGNRTCNGRRAFAEGVDNLAVTVCISSGNAHGTVVDRVGEGAFQVSDQTSNGQAADGGLATQAHGTGVVDFGRDTLRVGGDTCCYDRNGQGIGIDGDGTVVRHLLEGAFVDRCNTGHVHRGGGGGRVVDGYARLDVLDGTLVGEGYGCDLLVGRGDFTLKFYVLDATGALDFVEKGRGYTFDGESAAVEDTQHGLVHGHIALTGQVDVCGDGIGLVWTDLDDTTFNPGKELVGSGHLFRERTGLAGRYTLDVAVVGVPTGSHGLRSDFVGRLGRQPIDLQDGISAGLDNLGFPGGVGRFLVFDDIGKCLRDGVPFDDEAG